MNTELKEKMQKSADDYLDESGLVINYEEDNYAAGAYDGFIAGATAMYAELAPIVEWVSVEDKLPNSKERVIVKFYTKWSKNSPKKDGCIGIASYDSEEKFWHTLFNDFKQESVTHWRKIEL